MCTTYTTNILPTGVNIAQKSAIATAKILTADIAEIRLICCWVWVWFGVSLVPKKICEWVKV